MSAQANLIWESPGPVSSAFRLSRARIKALIGPVGAGKTTTCAHCFFDIAARMQPGPDGVIRCRIGVVRDTYRNLAKTVITSWHKVVPPTIGRWVGGGAGEPAFHGFDLNLNDERGPRTVKMEIYFFALGEHSLENVLRGFELTALYLNEADMLPADTLPFAIQRVGRYPDPERGMPCRQIILDLNAPEPDNWTYELLYENRPESYDVYIMPGGREPGAENVTRGGKVGAEYYDNDELNAQPSWYIRRMVDNLPGFGRHGTLVFPEYNDRVHCAATDLKPIVGLPILVGLDAGYQPAATMWQHPPGRWRGLVELHAAHMGPAGFGELLNAVLAREFPDFHILGTGDPTGFYGDPDQDSEDGNATAFAEIVSKATRVKFRSAPTNAWPKRYEAFRQPMTRTLERGEPAFQISPRMKQTRAALNGRYIFAQKKSNDTAEEPRPRKNHPYSDLMDTGQYVFCKFGEGLDVEARGARQASSGKVIRARTSFNVFA